MATQRCPKCKGDRIRQGYKPTPFLLKMVFIQNLLCNDCNWEFKGFAIPGTVSKKTKKKRNNYLDFNDNSYHNEFGESNVVFNEIETVNHNEKSLSTQDELISSINHLNNGTDDPVTALASDNNVKKLAKNKSKLKKKVRVKMH